MKIDQNILPLVTRQVNTEEYSSRVYLHLSNWCGYNGYKKAQAYFHKKAQEEDTHRDKLFNFLLDSDYPVMLNDVKRPDMTPSSLEDCVMLALKHEESVTASAVETLNAADNVKDRNTYTMFLWFTNEQREEEAVWIDVRDYATRLGLFDTTVPEYMKGMLRAQLEEVIGE